MESLKESPGLPLAFDLETREVLKQLALSHRKLAERKGIARTMPNERILISTLTLQEAQESSAIETLWLLRMSFIRPSWICSEP